MDWQPIATAPINREVLVFDANWCGRGPNQTVSYYTRHKGGGGSWSGVTEATHWMPLPEPPK
jgi:hypothetical protein